MDQYLFRPQHTTRHSSHNIENMSGSIANSNSKSLKFDISNRQSLDLNTIKNNTKDFELFSSATGVVSSLSEGSNCYPNSLASNTSSEATLHTFLDGPSNLRMGTELGISNSMTSSSSNNSIQSPILANTSPSGPLSTSGLANCVSQMQQQHNNNDKNIIGSTSHDLRSPIAPSDTNIFSSLTLTANATKSSNNASPSSLMTNNTKISDSLANLSGLTLGPSSTITLQGAGSTMIMNPMMMMNTNNNTTNNINLTQNQNLASNGSLSSLSSSLTSSSSSSVSSSSSSGLYSNSTAKRWTYHSSGCLIDRDGAILLDDRETRDNEARNIGIISDNSRSIFESLKQINRPSKASSNLSNPITSMSSSYTLSSGPINSMSSSSGSSSSPSMMMMMMNCGGSVNSSSKIDSPATNYFNHNHKGSLAATSSLSSSSLSSSSSSNYLPSISSTISSHPSSPSSIMAGAPQNNTLLSSSSKNFPQMTLGDSFRHASHFNPSSSSSNNIINNNNNNNISNINATRSNNTLSDFNVAQDIYVEMRSDQYCIHNYVSNLSSMVFHKKDPEMCVRPGTSVSSMNDIKDCMTDFMAHERLSINEAFQEELLRGSNRQRK